MSNATERLAAIDAQMAKLQSEKDDLTGTDGKVQAFIDAIVDQGTYTEASTSTIGALISDWEHWKVNGSLPSA